MQALVRDVAAQTEMPEKAQREHLLKKIVPIAAAKQNIHADFPLRGAAINR